eukprot:15459231-Alexandrium_andersonii.AAC.1
MVSRVRGSRCGALRGRGRWGEALGGGKGDQDRFWESVRGPCFLAPAPLQVLQVRIDQFEGGQQEAFVLIESIAIRYRNNELQREQLKDARNALLPAGPR